MKNKYYLFQNFPVSFDKMYYHTVYTEKWLRVEEGGTLERDYGTNKFDESGLKVILCTPFLHFIAYLKGNLNLKTTLNVVCKIKATIKRINETAEY